MHSVFLPHIAKVYKAKIVSRDLQEVRDLVLVSNCMKCKVVQEKGKWVNGAFVLETSYDTSIIFDSCADIEKGYEVEVEGKRYIISDIQERRFASKYDGGKRATCNTL